ncbi:MAG: hypothetical protein WB421_18810 [Terriglobales bacterium]
MLTSAIVYLELEEERTAESLPLSEVEGRPSLCELGRKIGCKAYSELTDAEIAEMTKWFLEHTIEDQGFRRVVEPKIVLEVAFNNMMESDRHESGYALRFPRIVRLRPDKLPEDADTVERAREIYEGQGKKLL